MFEKHSQGILLIALGHYQYGNMAANLAASIRFNDKDVKIHLAYSEGALMQLSAQHRQLFTSTSICPEEYYHRGEKKSYVKSKTRIYDLSPFERTLFLDVDMLWFSDPGGQKRPSSLFKQFADIDFTIENRGCKDVMNESELAKASSFWCDIRRAKEAYKLKGLYYDFHSEFIYFNRCKKNEDYFEAVKMVFDEPLIPFTNFGGDCPDEFAFDIASCLMEHYPHETPYVPIYWPNYHREYKPMNDVIKNYYGYSMGGAGAMAIAKKNYDQISKFNARALGLPGYYPLIQKMKFLPERKGV